MPSKTHPKSNSSTQMRLMFGNEQLMIKFRTCHIASEL